MQGKILSVKHGYNPNSSSMGSIIFALPVSVIAVAFGTAAVTGLILPHFIKDPPKKPNPPSSTDKNKTQS